MPGMTFGGKCTQWNFCNGASLVGKKSRWPGVVALVIAWATILGHALRVARANPIHALRYE